MPTPLCTPAFDHPWETDYSMLEIHSMGQWWAFAMPRHMVPPQGLHSQEVRVVTVA